MLQKNSKTFPVFFHAIVPQYLYLLLIILGHLQEASKRFVIKIVYVIRNR
jgi:hypothetical protein